MCVQDNHDFVFDYYAMADSDQTDAEPVTANVPIIQVAYLLHCSRVLTQLSSMLLLSVS